MADFGERMSGFLGMKKFIYRELKKSIAPHSTAKMKSLKKTFSAHRRADYFRAIEAWLADRELKAKIESEHPRAAVVEHLERRVAESR